MQIRRFSCALLLLLGLLLIVDDAFGQQTLRFKADRQRGKRVNKERIDFLIGNVEIRQGGTVITADSAQVQKQNNRAEAFGRINVQEGDSINIVGKRLIYEGGTGTAYIYNDVVYRDGKTTLYTDHLEFNKFTGVSSYLGGGRMVDGQNTLTSRQGSFDKPNSTASFFGKVVLVSPDATVTSDTLYYNTQTGQAQFKGFTKVVKTDGTVTEAAEGLTYNTKSENAAVLQGFIENQDYIITGDRLRYNRQAQLFSAEGRVKMTAKDKKIIIEGDEAYYDRKTGVTRIYGRPLMKRPVETDTLYLSADTMMSIESELAASKRLLAWGDVKVFKDDLQGVADSLAYRLADSVLFFYRQPVLWQEKNQLSGDTISMQIQNNKVDRMRLIQNGFLISQDTLINRYNQVKGRLITAFFGDNELKRVAVNGNAESIYFVGDDKNPAILVGMNRITCSNMLISFGEKTVQQIRFYQQPTAVFVPPHELKEPETKLQGFRWNTERRPSKAQVLSRLSKQAAPASGNKPKPAAAVNKSKPAVNKPAAGKKPALQQKPKEQPVKLAPNPEIER